MAHIHLHAGNTSAVISSTGAEMLSFKGNDGREVIWQADPSVWGKHAPILFPVCGRAKDDQVTIAGVTYPMERHGFSRTAEFQVAKYGDDFVDLVLTPTDASKPQYPFDFSFHVIYTLRENAFRTDFVIENKSDQMMPFCVGGHPGFIVPMEADTEYTDYHFVFPEKEAGRSLLVNSSGMIYGQEVVPFENGNTLPLHHHWFDTRDTLIFPELNSSYVDLLHKNSAKGLRFSYHKMEVLAIWSMPNKHSNYVCIEPWHGLPGTLEETGSFEDKAYATLLQPGMSYQCSYDVELI